MTITRVAGQAGGFSQTLGNTAAPKAFAGNITLGNLVLVFGMRAGGSSNPFAAGNVTKSAGAGAIGALSLDASIDFNAGGGVFLQAGVWSAQVTGTGAATMSLAAGGAGFFSNIAIAEYNSTLGAITFLAGTNKTGTGATGAPATASATSTGNCIFAGIVSTDTAGATTHTPGSSFTQIYEEENGASFATGNAQDKLVAALSSTADWLAPTTVPWAAALAVYQEPAASGGAQLVRGFMTAMTGIMG